jgi:hypothetical protein
MILSEDAMKRTIVARCTLCLVAVTAFLSLASCSDDGTFDPQPRTIAVVSGDNQPGKTGQPLGEPFVVRVTNLRGQGVEDVAVTWTITPGAGALGEATSLALEGVFDDDFERLSFVEVPFCAPTSAQTVRRTDSDGIAQVRFMPTWFGPVTVTARAVRASEPVTFTTDASDPGAVLTIVAGNHHVGKVGERDDWSPSFLAWHRFQVRLLDGQRNPVPYVPVRWVVTSGEVAMQGCVPGLPQVSNWTRAGPGGSADATFRLVAVGTSTVAAAVPGVLSSPVTFTVTATGFLITLADFGLGPAFLGAPDDSSDVTVPIGAPVEWANWLESARIVSTSAPPGGASFDSGELSQGERFEFVPDVAGTWEYVDQVTGATGTLTAG